MPRPVTLFTGQWADLPLETLCEKAAAFGYDGPELAWKVDIGPGYGEPTESMNEAVLMLARLEGLLFDPVYSGKALAGMIDYVREGRFTKDQNIVFLHTGGVAGLFAYADILHID